MLRVVNSGEAPVGFIGFKACRVEVAAAAEAEPVEHVLLFLVSRIGEDQDQPRITRPAPASSGGQAATHRRSANSANRTLVLNTKLAPSCEDASPIRLHWTIIVDESVDKDPL